MPLGFARGRLARRVKRTDVTRDSSSRAVFRSTAPRTPPAPPTNSEECGKKPPQEETGDEAKTKVQRFLRILAKKSERNGRNRNLRNSDSGNRNDDDALDPFFLPRINVSKHSIIQNTKHTMRVDCAGGCLGWIRQAGAMAAAFYADWTAIARRCVERLSLHPSPHAGALSWTSSGGYQLSRGLNWGLFLRPRSGTSGWPHRNGTDRNGSEQIGSDRKLNLGEDESQARTAAV